MFSTVLLWSCFVVSAFTSKCGNPPVCWCTNAVGIILCKNIDTLPFFNEDDKNKAILSSSLKKGSVSIFLHKIIPTALVHQQTGGLPHLLVNADTTKQDHKSTVENMVLISISLYSEN